MSASFRLHPSAFSRLREELLFVASRASGPGGQNVNRRATRVEARWRPADSAALTARQKARVRAALAPRISADGVLRVVSGVHRTQARNREACVERLRRLLERALAPVTPRRPTRPSAASKQRRRRAKAARAGRLADRRLPRDDH
ncbi:MAG: aminoacyl-tRNA hydrolase [Planctomycetes bacterium]|nr:aminoacyl-tRNA hydrolase [Planctomycetota bacterium]